MKILITGATSGIGQAIAKNIHKFQDRTHLILLGRNFEKLHKLKRTLENKYKSIKIEACDFSREIDLIQLLNRISNEKVDVIINSAADFGDTKNFLEFTSSEFMNSYYINVISPIKIIQAFLPKMVKFNFGRIINIGSNAGLTGYPLRTPYCITKHALIGLTKTINGEINRGIYGETRNVKAYCLCPGPVKGKRLEKQIKDRANYLKEDRKIITRKFSEINGGFLEPTKIVEVINQIISDNNTSEIVIFN